LATPHRRDRLY